MLEGWKSIQVAPEYRAMVASPLAPCTLALFLTALNRIISASSSNPFLTLHFNTLPSVDVEI